LPSAKTHPHIDRPSEARLRGLIEDRPAELRRLYLDVHRLVRETLPDVAYSVDCSDCAIGYGARQYGYDGWGMAALTPYAKWVALAFIRGTSLDDADDLLEGTGKTVRHVKLRTSQELRARRVAIRKLIESAARSGD
jgi:hypothetical protein